MCVVIAICFDVSADLLLALSICAELAVVGTMVYFSCVLSWFVLEFEKEHKQELDEEQSLLFERNKEHLRCEL